MGGALTVSVRRAAAVGVGMGGPSPAVCDVLPPQALLWLVDPSLCDVLPPARLPCDAGHGRPAKERYDQKTHKTNKDLFHDVLYLLTWLCLWFWTTCPSPGAWHTARSFGFGWAKAMGFALAALVEAKASAGTARSSCQLESSNWWRSCARSVRYTARIIRGSLSSAPIQT